MNEYLVAEALHIISVTAWMAGMFYLPRLYVYHADVAVGSEADLLFQTMERRLLRAIMNPAMVATFVFGGWLVYLSEAYRQGWWHAKMTLVVLGMGGIHGMLSKYRKDFARGNNRKSARYFRVLNEVPTVLFVVIVLLAVLKPF
ncbi:MAG: protoporphyrinogen oxidase HemJ [Rickettsiales bacterium]|nr:protoporphyrinogen oxidase HemJ [Rickettsiales bacterium]